MDNKEANDRETNFFMFSLFNASFIFIFLNLPQNRSSNIFREICVALWSRSFKNV